MHLFPKVNRIQEFLKRKFHINCVGGMLWVSGGVTTRIVWASGKSREDFNLGRMKQKGKEVSQKTTLLPLCESISATSDSLSQPIHTLQVKKKKRGR